MENQPEGKWADLFLESDSIGSSFEWVNCINKAGENKTYRRKVPRGQKRLDYRGQSRPNL